MERKTGWLARDGKFFELEAACRKHEAQEEIKEWCGSHNIAFEKVIIVIEALADPIMEYTNASEQVRDAEEAASRAALAGSAQPADEGTGEAGQAFGEPDSPEAGEDRPDGGEAGQDHAALLEQSLDRLKPVSNMGRRSRSKGLYK